MQQQQMMNAPTAVPHPILPDPLELRKRIIPLRPLDGLRNSIERSLHNLIAGDGGGDVEWAQVEETEELMRSRSLRKPHRMAREEQGLWWWVGEDGKAQEETVDACSIICCCSWSAWERERERYGERMYPSVSIAHSKYHFSKFPSIPFPSKSYHGTFTFHSQIRFQAGASPNGSDAPPATIEEPVKERESTTEVDAVRPSAAPPVDKDLKKDDIYFGFVWIS
ncbi:hypothetical protein QJS10_CPA05g00921 [Acorus calamus]|uniref:Uncharacterized protein n=1 Tax=Acorus calamus TaxID=4465 RepID=A0AAV9ESQ8_ACOCL|nr:hypothetical protein QJS10_CPA05g00921 [Acorus calamus]